MAEAHVGRIIPQVSKAAADFLVLTDGLSQRTSNPALNLLIVDDDDHIREVCRAVSEETGMISYAYKGQLTRGVTLEALRAFLTSVFVTPAKSRNWIGWLRSWTTARVKPSPVHLAKTEAAPTTPGGAVK